MGTSDLERVFEDRLRDGIRQSSALGYLPHRMEAMLDAHGAVPLARKLIKSGEIQTGLQAMSKLGRKDLTMESIMLEPMFKELFTTGELEAAAWRLAQA